MRRNEKELPKAAFETLRKFEKKGRLQSVKKTKKKTQNQNQKHCCQK